MLCYRSFYFDISRRNRIDVCTSAVLFEITQVLLSPNAYRLFFLSG